MVKFPATNIYLSEEDYVRYVHQALNRKRKVSELLQEAAREYLEKLEKEEPE